MTRCSSSTPSRSSRPQALEKLCSASAFMGTDTTRDHLAQTAAALNCVRGRRQAGNPAAAAPKKRTAAGRR
ncbi:hypothetical protein C1I99_02305 [Micromonospora deserti]|uniref:Uncharacterized protein n=1 Tax=Micromonospora deserti TaxID=2070366 RepID=A0A2W2CWX8_9ACTN|nr:hypothetical protein C1I99_02305 [Micromonospora deserti]